MIQHIDEMKHILSAIEDMLLMKEQQDRGMEIEDDRYVDLWVKVAGVRAIIQELVSAGVLAEDVLQDKEFWDFLNGFQRLATSHGIEFRYSRTQTDNVPGELNKWHDSLPDLDEEWSFLWQQSRRVLCDDKTGGYLKGSWQEPRLVGKYGRN